jgi:hypothetical protein
MVGSFLKTATAAALFLLVAGCAGTPRPEHGQVDQSQQPGPPLQCVPFARDQSAVKLQGDAYVWWDRAAGRYARSATPSEGAVMVLYNYAGPNHAHLAVVRAMVGPREIRVDHANWLNNGAVYVNNPVYDVSPGNDWSQVKIYNLPAGTWGIRVYPVRGFIGPGPAGPEEMPTPDDPLTAKIRSTLADNGAADGDGGANANDTGDDGDAGD